MLPTSPRYSKEEFAQRGDEIYERDVLPRQTAEESTPSSTSKRETTRSAGTSWLRRIAFSPGDRTHRFGFGRSAPSTLADSAPALQAHRGR